MKSGHLALVPKRKGKKKKINPPYWVNFPGGTDSLESTKNSQQN